MLPQCEQTTTNNNGIRKMNGRRRKKLWLTFARKKNKNPQGEDMRLLPTTARP